MIGFSDIMAQELMGPIGTSAYRGHARDISMSGSHLLAIISDIRDFAKTEATTMRLDESEFELGPMLENWLRFISGQVAELNVPQEIDCPVGALLLYADELRIKQIILSEPGCGTAARLRLAANRLRAVPVRRAAS